MATFFDQRSYLFGSHEILDMLRPTVNIKQVKDLSSELRELERVLPSVVDSLSALQSRLRGLVGIKSLMTMFEAMDVFGKEVSLAEATVEFKRYNAELDRTISKLREINDLKER